MSCSKCELCFEAKSACVRSRGSEQPLVLFVGEAPGREEDRINLSFSGPAGKELDKLMVKAALDPKWCRWGNVVRCVPWENTSRRKVRPPTDEEIDACCGFLEAEISAQQPIFIVPLGATAAAYFLGKCAISKVRGRRHFIELPTLRFRYLRMRRFMKVTGIEHKRLVGKTVASRERALNYAIEEYGYADVPVDDHIVFPTFHPAAILYGNPVESDILADLNYLTAQITDSEETAYDNYKLITTIDDLSLVVDSLIVEFQSGKIPWLSVDVETSSLNPYKNGEVLTTIAFTSAMGNAWCVPFNHHESPFKGDQLALAAVKSLLTKLFQAIPVGGHNFKFDYTWLYTRGIYCKKVVWDTELSAWTLFNNTVRKDLESLVTKYTDLASHKQEMREAQDGMPKEKKYSTDSYPLDLIFRYNCSDTDGTFRLNEVFNKMLREQGLYTQHVLFAVDAVIPTSHMEMNGCVIDLDVIAKMDKDLTADIVNIYNQFEVWRITKLVNEVRADKEFKLSSADVVCMILYDILGFEPTKFGKVRKIGVNKGYQVPSGDRLVLHSLRDIAEDEYNKTKDLMWKFKMDVLDAIVSFKKKQKILSGYARSLPKKVRDDGYCHSTYGIRHTASGRFNCIDPSLHTIPWQSDTKKAFISRFLGGLILNADFSQMELRVLAMASGDEGLREAFVLDRDIHTYVSARVLKCAEDKVPKWERHKNKQILFGMIYGRSAKSISKGLTQYTDMFENMTVEAAQVLIDSVFDEFPKIRSFIEGQHQYVQKYKCIWSLAGFRRFLPVDLNDREMVGSVNRRSVNTPIQGCASDLCVSAMISTFNKVCRVGLKSLLYQFVHDSLCWDTVPGELIPLLTILQKEMVEVPPRRFKWCNVPLKADFELGISWGHLVKLKILENNSVELSGNPDNFKLIRERFEVWPKSPKILEYEESISSLDEPFFKSIVEFPPRDSSYKPVYTIPGLT